LDFLVDTAISTRDPATTDSLLLDQAHRPSDFRLQACLPIKASIEQLVTKHHIKHIGSELNVRSSDRMKLANWQKVSLCGFSF
jgi:hypothetical protein